MTVNAYNCFWIESESSIIVANLNVDNLSRNGGSEDEANEWNEHGWQVRMRIG